MSYELEIKAIQTWIKQVTGINSWRLSNAKPKLARPVILLENPSRKKSGNLDAYTYTVRVRQYGKLFIKDLDEAIDVQEKLITDLEEKHNALAVIQNGSTVGFLKDVELEFDNTNSLDIPFNLTYKATYSKTRPADAPPATKVYTTVDVTYAPEVYNTAESVGVAATTEQPVSAEFGEPITTGTTDAKVDQVYPFAGQNNTGQVVV